MLLAGLVYEFVCERKRKGGREREGKKRKEEGRREGKEVSSKTNDDSVMSQDYR